MLINLERPPTVSDSYIWGDYIELLCVVSQDGLVSKFDILDRLNDNADIEIAETKTDDNQLDEVADDKQERQAADWFRQLEYRQGAFDKFGEYPFEISPDRDTLFLRTPLTLQHKFYIYLLIASNLRYVAKHYQHKLTSNFEWVSYRALQECLPQSAEVHIFGTSGNRYTGNLWQKIEQLSQDLHESVTITKEKISDKNVGDDGLDIVGWLPMGDELSNRILFFGQCACGPEWVNKQHDSRPEKWRRRITLATPPSNIIFIPHCFRDSGGNWAKPQDIHENIMVDRLRLVYFLREKYEMLDKRNLYTDVDELLSIHESFV